jgi:hypothetical protein
MLARKNRIEAGLSEPYRVALRELRSRPGDAQQQLLHSGRGDVARIIGHDELAEELYSAGAYLEASEEYYALIQSIHLYYAGLPNYCYHLTECLKKRTDVTDAQRANLLPQLYRSCKSKFLRFSDPAGSERARETLELGSYAALSGDLDFAAQMIEESDRLQPDATKLEKLLLLHQARRDATGALNTARRILARNPLHPAANQIVKTLAGNP